MKRRPEDGSHYDWLRRNLIPFLTSIKHPLAQYSTGLISAHGDKCYGYKQQWDDRGVPFEHGVALYLLSYMHPYKKESRETEEGWVHPWSWVADNYERFKPHLPPTRAEEKNV